MKKENTSSIYEYSIKTALTTFGERYTEKDVENFFGLINVEEGKFDSKYCSDMLTGKLRDD
jgi:hypothetical protein